MLFRVIFITALSFNTLSSVACEHLRFGTPSKSDYVECFEGYATGYDYTLKSAVWVAYHLLGTPLNEVERSDDFRVNPSIPVQYQTTPDDYNEPIYHQGHLANSESIDFSTLAMSQTFFMSNMVPQLPTHNTGIWKGLENRERKWAKNRKEVWVYAGPLYEGNLFYIGNQVPVPSHLWKVIYDPKNNESIAYLIEHKKLYTRDLDKYLVSIDEIELRANIDLLSLVNANEKSPQAKQWK